MKNIFIIGSKGIPANYGGFETFVDKLTENKKGDNIQYYISCISDNDSEFEHNGAKCFNVKVPNIGSAKAILYDIYSLKRCVEYIKEYDLKDCTIYILACRIGPFLNVYKSKLEKMGIKVYVNPDGHEWKRSKWSYPVRRYWKISEKLMIKNADLVICDSVGIEEYIRKDYSQYNPKTTFIAYGADLEPSKLTLKSKDSVEWYKNHNVKPKEYYLIVGRFVPENNYEVIIREFIKSNSDKELVIISNVEKNSFYDELLEKTKFDIDKRVKFVGTVYDQELLKLIREQAYAYIHGHEVGGTNPSLLEALASTDLNILLDVVFNKEVGKDGALYFIKEESNLAEAINKADKLTANEINELSIKAKYRVKNNYTWSIIVDKYEELFNK